MESFWGRLARGLVLGALMGLGLRLAGAGGLAAWVCVLAAVIFSATGVFVKTTSAATAIILLVGSLAWFGVTLPTDGLGQWAEAARQTAVKTANEAARSGPGIGAPKTEAPKLEDFTSALAAVKDACDKGLMSPQECADARAKIIARLTK